MNNLSPHTATEPNRWSPDELIPFGKYLLLDRISVGATSVLYRGRTHGEAGFERLVAVKRLLPHMAGDEDFVKTFVKEAKTAARLTHTNICPIFELGKVGESMYMTMEYVAGKDLRKTSRKLHAIGEPFPPEVAAYITIKLCDALDYAHNLKNIDGEPIGIIHRDISPPNILLSYEGQVKLIDFGLAKAVGQAQQTSIDALKQKLSYMSPEMVKGKVIDHRSDIFGLGVCLYEMITSRQLFEGKDDIATLKLVSAASIPPPSALLEDVPEDLEIIAMRALERDPEDRWQSAEELGLALQTYLVKNHPGYGPRQLSDWLNSQFAGEMKSEQERLNVLLEASRRPGIIEERRRFFTSPAGAAAIAKAEVIRRMSGAPSALSSTFHDDQGRLPAPPPIAAGPVDALQEVDEEIEELDNFEVIEDITPTRKTDETGIGEETTHFYDKPSTGEGGFEDEPTFFQAAFADSGAYEEDATQIFFNKEEGIGLTDIFADTNPLETASTPLLPKPLISPLEGGVPPSTFAQKGVQPGVRERVPTLQTRPASVPVWRSVYNWVMAFGLGLLLVAVVSVIFVSLRRPAVGSIEISTNPGATAYVSLDGVVRGRAPMRMDGVPVGLRHLEIKAEGYKVAVRDVEVIKNITSMVEVNLAPDIPTPSAGQSPQTQNQPAGGSAPDSTNKAKKTKANQEAKKALPSQTALNKGTLNIDSTPWARVFLDQKDTGGNTPISLRVDPGEHTIGLQTPDGQIHVEKVTVAANQKVTVIRKYGPKP